MSEGLIYFRDGELIAQSGNAFVYKMNNELFLEIGPGNNLWALESELDDYIDQLGSFPKGECLEIGLGLGVASRYILTFPRVTKLTTIEINQDVIDAHSKIPEEERGRQLDYDPKKHKIYNADGLIYAYECKKKYDFIFIDCYSIIDEDTLPFIADLAVACRRIIKPGGHVIGWLDKGTPDGFAKQFFKIFETVYNG
jgi:spermidine synthase